MLNWRYIVGTFAVRIPVTTRRAMLPVEEDTLAIMRWRLAQLTSSNRWVPVLTLHITLIEGRINALGGNSSTILPSPWGAKGAPGKQPHPSRPAHPHGPGDHDDDRHRATGKIDGVIYDRFGAFEGFELLTEGGRWHIYRSREADMEELIRFAWERRAVITVHSDDHNRPVLLTLRG
jgi:hypothetical protein